MGATDIQWTDRTDNAIRARNLETGDVGHFCEHASPGCIGCYAERTNLWVGTQLEYTRQNRDKVEIFLDRDVLRRVRRLRSAKRIFPCSMTDLFAEFVPEEMIDAHLALGAKEQRHTLQLLTKRPARMLDYFERPPRDLAAGPRGYLDAINRASMETFGQPAFPSQSLGMIPHPGWPLKNVWLGTSVEDQRRADERREYMRRLAEMGWLTWVSYEPAIGPVDWTGWEFLRWIVVGGQSVAPHRIFQLEWARRTLTWATANDVAFFGKQLGRWAFDGTARWPTPNDRTHGGEIVDFPVDLRVREFPRAA